MPVGNPEVVGLLEYWLDEARKGEIQHAALAAVKLRDQVAYDYAGARGLETNSLRALRVLEQEIEGIRRVRLPDPKNLALRADHVEFHLSGTPICWDFLIWLIDAEMTRRREGAPAPLRVAFTREEMLDEPSRRFFENVYRPLLPLFGAVEDADARGGRHKPLYTPIEIVVASKRGEEIPRPKASQVAGEQMDLWLHGTEPVVITLREAPHWKHRNSNLDAWTRFAADLEAKGQPVIFVRDTVMANEPLLGFATCPTASWNVDTRMALYERAKVNMCVSNGPAGLCLFGDRPYLYFLHIFKDEIYAPNNPGWWLGSNGVEEGGQWPWALPTQRMVWEPDTYENISAAWEALNLKG